MRRIAQPAIMVGVAAAVLTPTAAQAAPATTELLGTYEVGRVEVIARPG